MTAHPRVSGENTVGEKHGVSPKGSSPRERGKLVLGPVPSFTGRLIPA